jgi:uncharacterized protein YeaO (DUF488 family)
MTRDSIFYTGTVPIRVKRAYEAAAKGDGKRYLVDRVWPRGLRKDAIAIDAWLKELGPSTELRKWFGHEPARWGEFKKRYFEELESKEALWGPIRSAARERTVTLVYSARDEEHNQAVALREFLDSR